MRATLCFLALAVALGVACGDPTGPEDVAGTYTLQTVNGSGPPWFTLHSSGQGTFNGQPVLVEQTIELISGSLHLHGDATFSATSILRETLVARSLTGGIVMDSVVTLPPETVGGTYTVTGRTIQLAFSDGTVHTGSLSGRVLTMIVDGVAWVYER